MKKIFLFSALSFLCKLSNAQTDVIPPSLESEGIHRFDSYPVNHYTGLPDISVPIFTVRSGDLTFPIELKYHASGIKVTDKPGSVGLGWSLMAGGRISRTIKGNPDENPFLGYTGDSLRYFNYKYTSSYNFLSDLFYKLKSVTPYRGWDTENDLFSISIPTVSGDFLLLDNGEGARECLPVPFRPIKLTHSDLKGYSDDEFYFFDVHDEGGRRFRFGRSIDGARSNKESVVSVSPPVPSSWLLSEAISKDEEDTVSFHYREQRGTDGLRTYRAIPLDIAVLNDLVLVSDGGSLDDLEYTGQDKRFDYSGKMIKSIFFKRGKIEFIPNTKYQRINGIEIYSRTNGSYVLVKKVELHYNEFGVGDPYTLDQIVFRDGSGTDVYRYRFDYENEDEPFPNINSNNEVDFWGYYNGQKNSHLVPEINISQEYFSGSYENSRQQKIKRAGANRSATDAAKHSILTDMYLPTGGRTHFEYEGNFYDGELYSRGGGLRVKSIGYYDGDNLAYQTVYKYGKNESGKGIGLIEPDPKYYVKRSVVVPDSYTQGPYGQGNYYHPFRQTVVSSEPSIDLSYGKNPNVVYPEVTEYKLSATGESLGKTTFFYSFNPNGYDASDIVGELNQNYNAGNRVGVHSYYQRYYEGYGQDGNLLYKKVEDRHGNTVLTERYEYTALNMKTYYNLVLKNYSTWNSDQDWDFFTTKYYGLRPDPGTYTEDTQSPYRFKNYITYPWEFGDRYLITGATKLTRKTTTQSNLNGSITEKVQYFYDNPDHLFHSRVRKTSSSGIEEEQRIKYPQDYNSVDNLNGLVSENILDIPVKTELVSDGKLVSGSINKYNDDGNPVEVYQYELGGLAPAPVHDPSVLIETGYNRKVTMGYGSNNKKLVSRKKEGGAITSYLWGYNKQYPIAKIENATYDEIAYALGVETSELSLYNEYDLPEINSLRDSGFPNAMITTYTYDPLTGMTSMTDPNGLTTYYEYDGFGRLQRIRDHQNNILKEYEYNYKDPED